MSDLTPQQLEELQILLDPVKFAKAHFGWEARWYQQMILHGTLRHNRVIARMGRRTGKTDSLCVHCTWYTFTHENAVCLIAAPYESQVRLVFKRVREFIDKSPAIKASVVVDRRHPEYIEFSNGSVISGFTAGTKSGAEAGSARGQRADWIYLDEMDYLSEGDVVTITAIAAEDSSRIGIWASSTPTGRRGVFFDWCMNAQGETRLVVPPGEYTGPIWTEYYFPTPVIPTWNADSEAEFRSMYSDIDYTHEILADFGEEMIGVFNKSDVDLALQDYQYNRSPEYPAIRTIGTDWDKYGAGTQIAVVEYDEDCNKYRVINRVEIPRSERTLSNAVETIVALDAKYNPTHIYVDRGYGEMQVEALTEHLGKKVRGVSLSEKIDVVDPVTRLLDKKHIKPFMVNNAQILFERNQIWLSKYDELLMRQVLDYQVVRQTATGQPVFTDENEHALDALMLALLAFTIEHPLIADIIKCAEYARKPMVVDDIPFNRTGPPRGEEEIIVTAKHRGVPTWGPRGTGGGRRALSRRRSF
jgi:hypothetical protein